MSTYELIAGNSESATITSKHELDALISLQQVSVNWAVSDQIETAYTNQDDVTHGQFFGENLRRVIGVFRTTPDNARH